MRNTLSVLILSLAGTAFAQEADSVQLQAKMQERARIISLGQTSDKEASDLATPAYFLASEVDGLYKDLRTLERYQNVRLNSIMWSGYFWPNYQGGLGNRFQDPSFPKKDWGRARDYVRANRAADTRNEILSPSEKYDIVMGVSPEDAESLTTQQWRLGEAEYANTGKVATWQGICHGWAPAAVNFAVPIRPVVFSTRRGNITFTPDDIKALGSLLYANGKFEAVYTGVRCNNNSPATDSAGRIMTPECFDINPADWHILATHHIGMGRRPFVIDLVNTSEVWNKPVIGYNYQYVNIRHEVRSNTLSPAAVPISEARRLRYGSYRNSKTEYVVGIDMTITYLDGGFVRDNHNNTKEMSFRYDLELDAQYRIIGGEWQSAKHPDFVWKPRFVALPTTEGDTQTLLLKPWEAAVNPDWAIPAKMSNKKGTPLTKFVKYLFDYSGAL